MRLFARGADLGGWQLLASAPPLIHRELELTQFTGMAALFGAAAVVTILALLPIALAAGAIVPAYGGGASGRPGISRRSTTRCCTCR